VAGPPWRAARPGVGLLGIAGVSVAGPGLRRLDGLGIAPQHARGSAASDQQRTNGLLWMNQTCKEFWLTSEAV
jgi:hypothetical protein